MVKVQSSVSYPVFFRLLLSILIGAFPNSCFAASKNINAGPENNHANNGTVSFYDGRSVKVRWDLRGRKATASKSEKNLLLEEIWPQAKKIWHAEEMSPSYQLLAILPGSFTKKGARQKLIFYQYIEMSSYGIYGMVVIEDGKAVVHRGYSGAIASDIRVLPDLNNDGRNEIATESWSMHQGYRHGGIEVIELGEKDVKKFGGFEIADDDLNTNKCFKFELTAKPGPVPQFRSTKYQKIRNKWTQIGKTTTIEPLKQETDYVAP